MYLILAVILLATPCLVAPAYSKPTAAQTEEFDALTYLEKAGYLDDIDDKNRHHSPDNVKQALIEFQHMSQLPVTGRLDSATVKNMKLPRCGVPDVIKPSQRPEHLKNLTDDYAPLAYKTKGVKWHKNDLTYHINSFTKDLSQDQIRKTISQALKMWSDVTNLNFQEKTGYVDIEFEFVTRKHMDSWPFDGRGGTLAHAFQPGFSQINGNVHFDDDEQWTLGSYSGANLLQNAVHELGHAIGLDHSPSRSAIMYYAYLGYRRNFHLDNDDIRGIQSLYGKRRGAPTPTSRPRITPHPTPAENDTICTIRFNAILQHGDGRVYAFFGNILYLMSPTGATRLGDARNIFPGVPTSPGAAVYDRYSKKIYIFKGSQYWRYTLDGSENIPDLGYPRNLPTIFHNIDGAMQRDDHKIYVFIRSNFAQWTEGQAAHSFGYPRAINSYFSNAPPKVDASFHASNGYLYMFYGENYWRYLIYNGHEVLAPNFPKNKRPFWLGCGRTQGGYLVETLFEGAGK